MKVLINILILFVLTSYAYSVEVKCYFSSNHDGNTCEIRDLVVEQENTDMTKYQIKTELKNTRKIMETRIICEDSRNDVKYLPIGLIKQFSDDKNVPTIINYVVEGCTDLKSLRGNEFKDGGTLNDLIITKTGLEDIAPNTFESLKSLYHLMLPHNKLTKLDKKLFCNLSKLSVLDLAYNRIESLGGDLFSDLPGLSHLYLNSNKISNIGQDLLKHNINIRRVHLQENICISFNFNFVKSANDTQVTTFYDAQEMFNLNCSFLKNNSSEMEKPVRHCDEDAENIKIILIIVLVYIIIDLLGILIVITICKKNRDIYTNDVYLYERQSHLE